MKRYDRSSVLLFASTIFLSAYLLFQIQPLISKLILPWFGGSPTVWTTAMLFFQFVLFAGYVYAHLISRYCSPRTQSLTHIILLAMSAALATFNLPAEYLKPIGDENPIWKILTILGLSAGLPYFCLATTGPLIQYWFSQAYPGRSPYRLYALSNLGSFLALLSFPYVFEPLFDLPQLGFYWMAVFWIFVALCAIVAARAKYLNQSFHVSHNSSDSEMPLLKGSFAPSIIQRISWIALPALGSLSFIATTDHVSHDVAPEPRLWIATLSLYLLTFIICFDHPRWYRRRGTAIACLTAIFFLSGRGDIPSWLGMEWDFGATEVRWIHLSTMFLICFMCHGELVRQRPSSAKYLTEFYLWMSFGGACGGLFVALVATNFFADYYEWSLCLIAAIVLACFILAIELTSSPRISFGLKNSSKKTIRFFITSAAPLVFVAGLSISSSILFWEDPFHWRSNAGDGYNDILLHQSRNFYGTISVKERRYYDDPKKNYRVFFSGQITHGIQFLDTPKRRLPTTYFSTESGVGETIEYAKSQYESIRVAVIGLGAGTVATYARKTDEYDFYEINPHVAQVANHWFDYVPQCLARTKRIIIGDGRLKVEQLPANVMYDVIMMDAFSGGSVPIHLLTKEAFQLYQRHLKPNGLIVINITNGYLNLYPVVKRQAEYLHIGFRNKFQPAIPDQRIRQNQYFVMTNDRNYLQRFPSVNRRYFDKDGTLIRIEDPNLPNVPLWTDQFSSLNTIELRD